MGKIFYLMGKSASGKDTLYSMILGSGLDLREVILYTTRPMRDGEEEGREYHFIDEQRFEELRSTDKLIEYREYNTVHGIWRYMTVDDGQIDLSKNSYLMIGTLESYEKTRQYYGSENLLPIYVAVDDGIRLERALKREKKQKNPKYAEMCRRYLADEADFAPENLKRLDVNTEFRNDDDIEICAENIKAFIAERL
ncbi:MAG: guanylate kinase [Lachnospiraceae bacterium]|nr:guanylate kinase [Lachnospiraceae bacterium]